METADNPGREELELLDRWLHLWRDATACAEAESTPAEAAWCVLQHAALARRYTGEDTIREGIEKFADEERYALVVQACAYGRGNSLTDSVAALVRKDALDAADMALAEDILLQRDALQQTIDFATTLGRPFVAAGDRDLARDLMALRARAAEADEQIRSRPDIFAIAGRVLQPLRETFRVPVDEAREWWFGLLPQLDRKMAALAPADFGLPPKAPKPLPVEDDEDAWPPILTLAEVAEPVALAAATGDTVPGSLVISYAAADGALRAVLSLVPDAPSAEGVAVDLYTRDEEPLSGGELEACGARVAVAAGLALLPWDNVAAVWNSGGPPAALLWHSPQGDVVELRRCQG